MLGHFSSSLQIHTDYNYKVDTKLWIASRADVTRFEVIGPAARWFIQVEVNFRICGVSGQNTMGDDVLPEELAVKRLLPTIT